MEKSSAQLATSETRCVGLEDRLQQTTATCQTVTAEVDALRHTNQELTEKLEEYEKEKIQTGKTIAMLEFNNEHNINKVR